MSGDNTPVKTHQGGSAAAESKLPSNNLSTPVNEVKENNNTGKGSASTEGGSPTRTTDSNKRRASEKLSPASIGVTNSSSSSSAGNAKKRPRVVQAESAVKAHPTSALREVLDAAENAAAVAGGKMTTPVKKVVALAALSNGDLGPALCVEPGQRLQVLWVMTTNKNKNSKEENAAGSEKDDKKEEDDQEDGDQDEEEDVWWPAAFLKKTGRMHELDDHEQGDSNESRQLVPIYQIKYDPLPPYYDESETSDVCLVGQHELYDISTKSLQHWRFEGENWHSEEDDSRPDQRNIVMEAALENISQTDLASIRSILMRNNLDSTTGFRADISSEEIVHVPDGQLGQAAQAMVDSIIANVLKEHGKALLRLPASVQFQISDDVTKLKAALVDKITVTWQEKRTLGAAEAREIVAAMTEEITKVKASRGY